MNDRELTVGSVLEKLHNRFDDRNGTYPLQFILSALGLEASPQTFTIIYSLEQSGYLKRIYRIESPTLGGLEDFSSISDIPPEIEDFRTGCTLEVTPKNIKVLYTFISPKESRG